MSDEYTIVIRKTEDAYIALCMELNICSTGDTLQDVNQNLMDAIKVYIEDIKQYPETVVKPISTKEFIEFLRDTDQNDMNTITGNNLKSYEINTLPVYA